MNGTNNFSARQSYEQAKALFMTAFMQGFKGSEQELRTLVNSFKLSQGEIRLEVPLSTTSAQFVFGVSTTQQSTGNTGSPYNTEKRLPYQDSICVSEMGLFVGKPASSSDTDWKLRTYGNIVDFSANAALAIDSTLYSHGQMEIKVNNDVLVPNRGLFNFLYKGQTQQTDALGVDSPNDEIRGADDGFITVEPNIVLIGSKQNVITINLPKALTAADANSRAILILRGIYAQNSTVVS